MRQCRTLLTEACLTCPLSSGHTATSAAATQVGVLEYVDDVVVEEIEDDEDEPGAATTR